MATPIQIPQLPSMLEGIQLAEAVRGFKQNRKAQKVWETAKTPEELAIGLRGIGGKPYMDFVEWQQGQELNQIQQIKARNDAIQSAIPEIKRVIGGLIETANRDESTAQTIAPGRRQYLAQRLQGLNLPPEVLDSLLPPEQFDKTQYDSYLHSLETAEEHAKHLNEELTRTKNQFELDEAKKEAERQAAAEARAVADQEAEVAGGHDWVAWRKNAEGILGRPLTPQEEQTERSKFAQRGQRPVLTPEQADAVTADPVRYWDLPADAKAAVLPILQSRGVKIPPSPIDTRQQITIDAGNPKVEIPSEYKTALERAISNLPAGRRRFVVQTANGMADDPAELKEYIRQAAIESEDVNTKRQVEGRAMSIGALQEMSKTLQELKAAGVDTNILSGTAEDIARKLGTSTDPRLVELGTRMARALNTYTLSMSGVQFSVQEAAMYEKMFPNYRNTMPVNEATIRGLSGAMADEDRVFWERKLGRDGYRLIAPSVGQEPGAGSLDDEILKALEGLN